jgi:hypothetical protein
MIKDQELKLTNKEVVNWFGNRGYCLEKFSGLKYKAVTKQNENWLFILDDCFEYEGCDEIETYCLDSDYCEPYDAFNANGFDWSIDNLLNKIEVDA